MGKFEVEREFAASADAVWEKLGDFGGLAAWMPGIQRCDVEGTGLGALRTVAMPGGVEVVERLEARDDEARTLSYSIVKGPLPVQDYLATIRVHESGPRACRVDWSARFELPPGLPEEGVVAALTGAYGGALDALRERLAS